MVTTESYRSLSPEAKNAEFFNQLRVIIEKINRCSVPIALVGGIPLDAYLGVKATGIRGNGSVRDIDAIAYCKDTDDIKIISELNKELRLMKKNSPFCPEIGIEPLLIGVPKKERPKPNHFLSDTFVDFSAETPRFYLHYGEVVQDIPRETMDIVKVAFGDLEIPTLRDKTLWFRYFIRGVSGVLKPKDYAKVGMLYCKLQRDDRADNYSEFNTFTEKVRNKYPDRAGLFTLYWSTIGEYLASLSFANELKDQFVRH